MIVPWTPAAVDLRVDTRARRRSCASPARTVAPREAVLRRHLRLDDRRERPVRVERPGHRRRPVDRRRGFASSDSDGRAAREAAQRDGAAVGDRLRPAAAASSSAGVNHVERRLERAAHLVAGERHLGVVGAETSVTRLDAARRAGRRPQVGDRPGELQLLRDLRSRRRAPGPSRGSGESVSYGSATETRYGTASPVASSADTVRPPEVEKKSVSATLPS